MKKKITQFLMIAFLFALQANASVLPPSSAKGKPLGSFVECAVPVNVTVTDVTATAANFSWTPTTGDLDSYFFQYCVVASPTPEDGPTTNTGTTGSTYFDLTPNTTYYVYVRSFCAGGVWSDWSQPATFTTSILSYSDFAFKGFSVYPNPANDVVRLSNDTVIGTVAIFNALGQNVFLQEYNDFNVEVDIANFSKGYYFMKVHSGTYAKTVKLVKK